MTPAAALLPMPLLLPVLLLLLPVLLLLLLLELEPVPLTTMVGLSPPHS